MPNTRITAAGPEDVNVIKSIEIACGLSPWTPTAYEAELKRADSLIAVAWVGDSRVGFVAGRTQLVLKGEAAINNIGVLPAYRGRGIGSCLLMKFRDVCIDRQTTSIWLEVRASNLPAMALYRSHGFVAQGLRPNFYSDPVEDAQIMTLSLGEGGGKDRR